MKQFIILKNVLQNNVKHFLNSQNFYICKSANIDNNFNASVKRETSVNIYNINVYQKTFINIAFL